MIYVECFEDITMYQYIILKGGAISNICIMKVIINGNIYNYNQSKKVIIISNNEIYSNLHNSYCTIPLKQHFELLDLSKKRGIVFYVKINGTVVNDKEYEFVDMTRTFKLKQLLNNE